MSPKEILNAFRNAGLMPGSIFQTRLACAGLLVELFSPKDQPHLRLPKIPGDMETLQGLYLYAV